MVKSALALAFSSFFLHVFPSFFLSFHSSHPLLQSRLRPPTDTNTPTPTALERRAAGQQPRQRFGRRAGGRAIHILRPRQGSLQGGAQRGQHGAGRHQGQHLRPCGCAMFKFQDLIAKLRAGRPGRGRAACTAPAASCMPSTKKKWEGLKSSSSESTCVYKKELSGAIIKRYLMCGH